MSGMSTPPSHDVIVSDKDRDNDDDNNDVFSPHRAELSPAIMSSHLLDVEQVEYGICDLGFNFCLIG